MTLVLVSLAVMVVVELMKSLVPWPLRTHTKLMVVIGASLALYAGLERLGVKGTVLSGLASGGLSLIVHETHAVLQMVCDDRKHLILMREGTARRRNAP